MSIAPDQSLNGGISENACGPMRQSLIELLMHERFEGFDHDFDAQVIVTIEHLPGIDLFHHQAPFLNINDLVSQR